MAQRISRSETGVKRKAACGKSPCHSVRPSASLELDGGGKKLWMKPSAFVPISYADCVLPSFLAVRLAIVCRVSAYNLVSGPDCLLTHSY